MPDLPVVFYVLLFIYGIVIGSFVNVLIYRLPKHEDFVKIRSHCMNCGYQLRWFDLIPIVSWVIYGGKCRKCGQKISAQYPLIEALNGILYVLVGLVYGISIDTVLLCLASSILVAISVIDFRTMIIPPGLNIAIGVLGIIRMIFDLKNFTTYLVGFAAVSGFLLILYMISKGRWIGGGDIKLMAATGLLIGWKLNILAFFLGCIYGSVIHIIRMKISGKGHVLALGPYLAAGVMTAVLVGKEIIDWYFGMLG
jgi:leader peptidase (prepilin peptidase)/N-methyltransferase